MSKIELEGFYSNGPLYNLISDERGSFYRDVHGLTHLIAELPLDHGILELGSGWDERGALMIQHELRNRGGTCPVTYVRDADQFVDLTVADALAPVWNNSKFSCVTGLCYLLNALNTTNPIGPADYYDLVTALKNVRSVLTDDGAAVFGIYEPGIDAQALNVEFTTVRYPNPRALHRLDPTIAHGSELSYGVEQSVEGPYMSCWFHDVKVGHLEYEIQSPLWTTLWTAADIRGAAEEAGFADVQFFNVTVNVRNGYSEFSMIDCAGEAKAASHVLLLV